MSITFKTMTIISFAILLLFTILQYNLNISFEKSKDKNGFADKNVIPICCAWGPGLQDGVLTYSINGQTGTGDQKSNTAVAKAVDSWNQNLNGIQFQKSPNGNADIFISFINDGKKVAGKTVNSIDGSGLIRQSYVTLSKEYFNRPFSSAQLEQVAEHELGHVLGLNHVKFSGNLMSTQVEKGSATISPCLVEAVDTANAWKVKEGGVSMHGPPQNYIVCK